MTAGRTLLAVTTVVVVGAVAAGLAVLGPPGARRQEKLDLVRVQDLMSQDRAIHTYAKAKHKLPQSIAELAQEPGYSNQRRDPESGVPYEYELAGPDTYRLCATFASESTNSAEQEPYWMIASTGWSHASGRQCFSRNADTESQATPGR